MLSWGQGPLAVLGGSCPGSSHRGMVVGTWSSSLMSPQVCAGVLFTQQFHLEQLILNSQGVDHSLGAFVSTPHQHQR